MSSFVPDERSLSGRIEISRNLKMMRKKVMNIKPCVNSFQDPSLLPRAWRSNVYNKKVERKPKEMPEGRKSRPSSARPSSARKKGGFSSMSAPPETLGLAKVLSTNRRRAQRVDYSKVVHTKRIEKMYSKIESMESDLKPKEPASSRLKGHPTRVSIDWDTGHVFSAPTSPLKATPKAERKKTTRRPQSAPVRRNAKNLRNEQCRAYKEAIKDYIVENSLYEEDKLQELFENYKKDKQEENEDIIIRAIEELKLELNVA